MYSMQTLGVSLTVGVQDIADRSLAHRHKLRGCTDTKTHGCINTQGAQFIGQVNQRQKKSPKPEGLGDCWLRIGEGITTSVVGGIIALLGFLQICQES